MVPCSDNGDVLYQPGAWLVAMVVMLRVSCINCAYANLTDCFWSLTVVPVLIQSSSVGSSIGLQVKVI